MSRIHFETHPWLVIIDWPKVAATPDEQKADNPGQDVFFRGHQIQEWLNEQIGHDWLSAGTSGLIDPETETFRVKVADEVTATMVLLRWS